MTIMKETKQQQHGCTPPSGYIQLRFGFFFALLSVSQRGRVNNGIGEHITDGIFFLLQGLFERQRKRHWDRKSRAFFQVFLSVYFLPVAFLYIVCTNRSNTWIIAKLGFSLV